MADKAGGYRGGVDAALADFVELLGKAILSGIAASLVLALVALGLSTTASAQATPNDAKTGTRLFRTAEDRGFAPAPKVETLPARVPDLCLGEPIAVSELRGTEPWSVALTPSPSGEQAGVGALWARTKFAPLADEPRPEADEATIRPAVLTLALEHHLVSRSTSLVAVDVTPAAPAGDKRTTLVKASVRHGVVAGQFPQTDAESTLQILLGLLALAAAGTVALVGRLVPAGGTARMEEAR